MNLYPIEINSDVTVSLDLDAYIIDASGNDVTLTLPDMTGFGDGAAIIFKRKDSNTSFTVTISATGTTIDGGASITISINGFNVIVYDGSVWTTIEGGIGCQGPQGFQGFQGAQGSQGFQGSKGNQGFVGAQGFQGAQGAQGAQGFEGSQGAQGATGNTNGWLLNGNTVGSEKWIGTIDNFNFPIRTNNVERARFLSTGEFIIGANSIGLAEIFSIQKSQNAGTYSLVANTTSGASAYTGYYSSLTSNLATSWLFNGIFSAGYTSSGILVASTAVITSTTVPINLGTRSAVPLSFWTNNVERARFLSTGEFLIGSTSVFGSEFVGIRKDQNALTLLRVHNDTSGTASKSIIIASTATSVGSLQAYSALFTTSGINVADAVTLSANAPSGMNVGTTSNAQLSFWTNNTKRIIVPALGGLVVGIAALGTTATDGFIYIPTCAGAPTGVPVAQTGTVAMIYDTTNNNFYIYNGAWKKVALA